MLRGGWPGEMPVSESGRHECLENEEAPGAGAHEGRAAGMNTTTARIARKGTIQRMQTLRKEIELLSQIPSISLSTIEIRQNELRRLELLAEDFTQTAALEDVSVHISVLKKKTNHGVKEYPQWVASWRIRGKVKNTYIGMCSKIDEQEALRRAKTIKARSLGLEEKSNPTRPIVEKKRKDKQTIVLSTLVELIRPPVIGRGIIGDDRP